MHSKTKAGLAAMASLVTLVLSQAPALALPAAAPSIIGNNQTLVVQIRQGTGCLTWRGTCRLNITGPKAVGTRCYCRNRSSGISTWGKVVR